MVGIEFKGILPERFTIRKIINKERLKNLVTLALTKELMLSIKVCFKIE
jgi:hypothetical protein